jgi:2-polyprenyl-6-methoxyphenol hydroxylase-like FAD-dependent oxidoreductase
VLRRRCAEHPLVDLRLGLRFTSLKQDDDGVSSSMIARDGHVTVRSAYVVGCDGASSSVRKVAGITVDGGGVADGDRGQIAQLPTVYSVTFTSRDLRKLHRHGYFWHYFTYRYALISLDGMVRWALHGMDQATFDPPPADPAAWVRSVLNVDLEIDDVVVTSQWRPQYLIAKRYQAGRVMLAGDAAHQMFPAGSYGLNTGTADAVDIGWKLAALVNGFGGEDLLESYTVERRPVALRNMRMSRHHLDVHFGQMKLIRDGAEPREVGAFLRAQPAENTYEGIYLGYRYAGSPVVCADGFGAKPGRADLRYVPTTLPGARPPSVLLSDGRQLYDLFGPEFTLIDFAGDGCAAPLIAAAGSQRLPLRHAVVREAQARALWERDLVLIRPDQHVAWRGNHAPADAAAVIRRVRGAARPGV